ncbi:hypothetical protein BCR42DRAFT_407608 [Absidia repens]|uniref:Uncharacterized protein n=1 Tax=Absidia repens TaxID=90262 RepID=A0A1X2IU39_9FUNG|nr:hypothetical protein BCR42DRAFT_407608 [Absidia repens]
MVRSTAVTFMSLVGVSSYFSTLVSAGGMIGQVVDSTNFCVFLPPPGQMHLPLSDNEWDSQAYCLGDTPKAIDANTLPDGFIRSAHYVATDEYVQVTGQFDPTKIGLSPDDDGGQCDIAAPKGSSCAGWKYYVNLMEPSGNTYCMRCCNDTKNCNRGISEKGCAHIIPGDYSGPMDGSGGDDMPTASSSTSPPTHTQKSSSTTKEPESTSSPDSDASPTTSESDASPTSSSSDGDDSSTSSPSDDSSDSTTTSPDSDSDSDSDSGSGSGSGSGSETSAPSSSSETLPSSSSQVPPSSSLPAAGVSSSVPNSSPSGGASGASGSQSGDLTPSSVTEQSVSQGSSLTSSIVVGGFAVMVTMIVSA